MFTGIVQELGKVAECGSVGPSLRFRITAPRIAAGLKMGDSVACNGVCLTAEQVFPDGFAVTAVPETLSRTALGDLGPGGTLNLEPALSVGTPLGGHFMQGHVDGVAEVTEVRALPNGGGKELTVRIPRDFARYCVEKGSFGLHGVSLTIAAAEGADGELIRFALVPHTLAHTTLDSAVPGQRLNFEVDMLGKYVERLLAARPGMRGDGV
ncbi:MAG TPA: riboflavin synthase [Fibrobacteria bacterium]|nr:riboflavin synthase [Fibrobacteria bacterium]